MIGSLRREGRCRNRGCRKTTKMIRRRRDGDEVKWVPALHCSPRCAVKDWRNRYEKEFGISYDTEKSSDLRLFREE